MKTLCVLCAILTIAVPLTAQDLKISTVGVSALISDTQQTIGYSWPIADAAWFYPAARDKQCAFTKAEKAKFMNGLAVKTCPNGVTKIYMADSHDGVCSGGCSYEGAILDWSNSTQYFLDGSNFRIVGGSVYAQNGTFTSTAGSMPAAATLWFRTWWTSYADEQFPEPMGGLFAVELGQN